MSGEEEHYQSVRSDFKNLVSYAFSVSAAIGPKLIRGEREHYAELIFAKQIFHGITLARIVPVNTGPGALKSGELWDLSSACALTRTLIESYDALSYIAVDPVSNEIRRLRVLMWEIHAEERRLKMLRLIASVAPEVSEIEARLNDLKNSLFQVPEYQALPVKQRNEVERGDCPAFIQTQRERNLASDVSHDYYNSAIMFLSSHVHTHPFAITQLMKFRVGAGESLRILSVPIQYATGFVAKGIQGMRYIFGSAIPAPSKDVEIVIGAWLGIVSAGVKMPANHSLQARWP